MNTLQLLPARISVCPLPTQQDTLALVERIVNTCINCLTIHFCAHNMRPRERALVHRLKEIVDFVKSLGRDVAVIENGDCVGFEDARRIRAITGADSVMIATAAEANPTVFSPHPLTDLEDTFILPYLRLVRYIPLDFHTRLTGRISANIWTITGCRPNSVSPN